MGINTQQINNAAFYAAAAVQPTPQSVQSTHGKGATNSPQSDDVPSLSPVTDQVQLSPEARQAYEASLSAQPASDLQKGGDPSEQSGVTVSQDTQASQDVNPLSAEEHSSPTTGDDEAVEGSTAGGAETGNAQLSAEEQQQVLELELRDQEVQVHEAAHAAVGGQYAGAPSLTYETGPDGKRYAVSGEVNVDMSEVAGDPAATMKKADVIRAAALAPAQPSSQDRNVAARAAQMKTQAQAELMAESAEAGNQMVKNSVTGSASPAVADEVVSDVAAPRFSGAVA